MSYRFADFLLDPEAGSLTGPDGPVHLRPQGFHLLELLVTEAPRVLSVDEIVDRVWGVDHVSSASIRQVVSELRQALGDSATRPQILETVHRRGYRLIAPVERLVVSGDEQNLAAGRSPRPPVRRPAIIAASLMVLVGIGWWVLTEPRLAPGAATGVGAKPRLAVLALDNLTSDPNQDWLDPAIRDLLRGELALPGTCRLTAGKDAHASADILLQGSYFATSDQEENGIRFQIQIQDAASGETLGWARETGDQASLPEIARRLARSVLAIVVEDGELSDRSLAAQRHLASSTESLKLFVDAIEASIRLDDAGARSSLERALEIDPDNPLHHDLLAATYHNMGLDPLARESAERAMQLSTTLSAEQRQSVTARAAEIEGRWSDAEEVLRRMALRFPDEVSYRIRLARSLLHQGRLAEAHDKIHSFRQLPAARHGDPRLDLLEIRILRSQRRFVEAERIARGLQVGEPESTSESLPAEALETLFRIHLKTGRLQEAEEVLEQLDAAATGDSGYEARLTGSRASLLERQGRFAESRAAYRSAVRQFADLGDRRGEVSRLNQWALLLDQIDEIDAAASLLERAIQVGQEAGNQLALAVSQCLAAGVYVRLGRLEEARRNVDQALEWSADTDDPQRTALCLRASAFVLLAEKRWPAAEERYRQALELSLGAPDMSGASEAYYGLGSVARETDRPHLASAYFTRAAAGFERLARWPRWLDSRCTIAEIRLESDDPTSSRLLFEEVLERASEWSLDPYQVRARAGLAGAAKRSATSGRHPNPAAGQT